MRRQRLVTIGLMAVLASLLACGGGVRGLVGSIEDGLRLAQQLQQQTGQSNIVVVVVNGEFPGITLTNSAWNNLPIDQKREKSLDVARLAYKDYPGGGNLFSIDVSYSTDYEAGPLHYRVRGDKFEFFQSDFTRVAPMAAGQAGADGK